MRLEGRADVHVIWMPVLRSDTEAAAREVGEDLAPAPLRSAWLADRALGHDFSPVLGLRNNRLAWDVVLVFGADAQWSATLPTPVAWWHQLQGEDPAKRMGPGLADDVVRAVDGARVR